MESRTCSSDPEERGGSQLLSTREADAGERPRWWRRREELNMYIMISS